MAARKEMMRTVADQKGLAYGGSDSIVLVASILSPTEPSWRLPGCEAYQTLLPVPWRSD